MNHFDSNVTFTKADERYIDSTISDANLDEAYYRERTKRWVSINSMSIKRGYTLTNRMSL